MATNAHESVQELIDSAQWLYRSLPVKALVEFYRLAGKFTGLLALGEGLDQPGHTVKTVDLILIIDAMSKNMVETEKLAQRFNFLPADVSALQETAARFARTAAGYRRLHSEGVLEVRSGEDTSRWFKAHLGYAPEWLNKPLPPP